MAIKYSDSAAILSGNDLTNNPSLVTDGRKQGAKLRVVEGVYTTNNANADIILANDIRLAWVPFGARVRRLRLSISAVCAALTDVDVGLIGVSGTTYDNKPTLFQNAANWANAQSGEFPSDAALLAGGDLPYTVTDPKGAWVVVDPQAGNTSNQAARTIYAEVEYTHQ